MSILRPHLPHDPTETSWSYAARLAAFHTGGAIRGFLSDLGISVRDLRAGEMPALARLAQATGAALDALVRSTVRMIDSETRQFRDETWTKPFVPSSGALVCPACLLGDVAEMPGVAPGAAWKQRVAWGLRPVTSCPEHGIELVDVMVPSLSATSPTLASLVPLAGGARRLMAEARPRVSGPLERWIHDRLSDRPEAGGPWLAGQTIEQGARACEMLGAVHRHGPQMRVARLTPDDWRTAGDHGFEIAREGQAAVRAALDDIRAAYAGAAEANIAAIYGPLFAWLSQASAVVRHGPIRALLREHILDHHAIDPGRTLLCEPVAERRMHSIRSLSDAIGLDLAEVSRRLVQVGLMPTGAPIARIRKLAFPAAEAERLCLDLATTVPLLAAANLLGCTAAQADSLREAGVLNPMLVVGTSGSDGRFAFVIREVTGLVGRLRSLAKPVDSTPGEVDLDAAAGLLSRSCGEVVAMVLSGRLEGVRRSGYRSGLSALRLPRASIETLTTGAP